jgi:hypothetical protein
MYIIQDRQLRPALILGLLLCLGFAILYSEPVRQVVGTTTIAWIFDWSAVLIALGGAVLALLIALQFRSGEVLRRVWLLMSAGLFLWGMGELLWAINETITGGDPYPIADIFWILGYIPLILAMFLRFRSLQISLERERLIVLVIIFGAMLVLAWLFVFRPIIAGFSTTTADDAIASIINIMYPIGDLVVAMTALLVVFALTGGKLSQAWIFITAGFVLIAASDLIYTYAYWAEIYGLDGGDALLTAIIDVSYFSSYMLIAIGLYAQARLQKVV